MHDSDMTLHSDNGYDEYTQLSPKRVRPASTSTITEQKRPMSYGSTSKQSNEYKSFHVPSDSPHGFKHNSNNFIEDPRRLASSLYSFTYEQNTGSLLSIRLAAMQKSLLAIQSQPQEPRNVILGGSTDHFDNLAKNLTSNTAQRLASGTRMPQVGSSVLEKNPHLTLPLDDHQRQTDEDMLEFLTVPYMDVTSEDRPFIRPPSMTRRASSMILQNKISPHSSTSSVDEHTKLSGIPTPLPHQPHKGTLGQAVFTTEIEAPFRIKTLNDVARALLGLPDLEPQSIYFNDLIAPQLRTHLEQKIAQSNSQIRLSGDIVLVSGGQNDKLLSIWVDAPPNSGVLIWVIAPAPATKSAQSGSQYDSKDVGYFRRVETGSQLSLTQDVYISGPGLWMPQNIASAVIADVNTQHILSYNYASLNMMLGVEGNELISHHISDLIPQFPEFWSTISHFCVNSGVVVSEHAFRQLVGVPLHSPAFTSPYPSRDPHHSIVAKHGKFSCFVDLQVRVFSEDYLVIWISYSRPTTTNTSNLLPQIVSVTSATPPRTPKITPGSTPGRTPVRSGSLSDGSPIPGGKKKTVNANLANCEIHVINELSPSARASVEATQSLESKYMNIKVGEHRRSMTIESFEIIKELGHGAYGEVKLVRTPNTHDIVALKSIYKDRILIDTWSRDRLLGTIPNEIRILNELRSSQHPNIVWMIDFFEDRKCYHLTMIPCGSPHAMDLFDFIETKSESQSPMELLNIWKQIVSAVAHIHSLKIVHRDLKDENVIIDSEGVAKLIDFGSSAYVKQGPFDLFVGTVDYAAPEIVLGELYHGIPQDVWALGILLYTIFFREVPYKDSNEIVSTELPTNPPTLGDHIFKAILQKDPAVRPSALELLQMVP